MAKQKLSLTELGKLMHQVHRVFKKRCEVQQFQENKISVEQFSLLYALSLAEEEVIQKDMAEILRKDKSAILRLIDTLEEKELVRRVVDSKDRRKNYLMVTKVGYRVIEQYMKIVDDLMDDIQQGLSQSEIDTFEKVARQMMSKAEKL